MHASFVVVRVRVCLLLCGVVCRVCQLLVCLFVWCLLGYVYACECFLLFVCDCRCVYFLCCVCSLLVCLFVWCFLFGVCLYVMFVVVLCVLVVVSCLCRAC